MLLFWSLLYSTILHSQVDALHAHVILHEWTAFYSAFLNIHRSGVLKTLTWLVPHDGRVHNDARFLPKIHTMVVRTARGCRTQLINSSSETTFFGFQVMIQTRIQIMFNKLHKWEKHSLSLSKGGSSLRLLSGLRVSTKTVHGFSWSAKSCTC